MTEQQINDVWAEHRSYLVDLAFRMLGDVGEAEDVVQEAFYRLSRTEPGEIDEPRGWLVVVTSRLCLDIVRSARARRERPAEAAAFDAAVVLGGGESLDPSDRVTLDESVKLALLVVLERLTPAERVAFVLHDIFRVPFESVAETVGRPVATCRQLARRARQKLEAADAGARFGVTAAEHRDLTDRFIAACTKGSFEGLLEVLAPDVWGGVDLRPSLVVRGAEQVARNLLRFWGRRGTLVSLPNGDRPSVLAFVDRELAAVMGLVVRDGLLSEIHVIAEPRSLRFLSSRLTTSAGRELP